MVTDWIYIMTSKAVIRGNGIVIRWFYLNKWHLKKNPQCHVYKKKHFSFSQEGGGGVNLPLLAKIHYTPLAYIIEVRSENKIIFPRYDGQKAILRTDNTRTSTVVHRKSFALWNMGLLSFMASLISSPCAQ